MRNTDLISRQAAIEAIVRKTNCTNEEVLRQYVRKQGLDGNWSGGIRDSIDAVLTVPTEESRIVRCKDCVKRRTLKCPFGIMTWDAPGDGEYCSRGALYDK